MRVQLRPVIASDLPIFFAQQLDPVANSMAVVNPRDRESFDDHWRKVFAPPFAGHRPPLSPITRHE